MERTFIIITPDGIQRGLAGKIITRFEQRGYRLIGMKFIKACKNVLKSYFANKEDNKFISCQLTYMSSGPVLPMVWEGMNVVWFSNMLLDEHNAADEVTGCAYGERCVHVSRKLIYGSDTAKEAKKDICLWFTEDELVPSNPWTEKFLLFK